MCMTNMPNASFRILRRISKGSFWKKALLAVAASADRTRDSWEGEGVRTRGRCWGRVGSCSGVSSDFGRDSFLSIHLESMLGIVAQSLNAGICSWEGKYLVESLELVVLDRRKRLAAKHSIGNHG